jgi:DNA invertase Pin-like site-specific DNA recombinase
MVTHFTDVESGKKADRPQLLAAIQFCKQQGAVLLIAKLDRFTRNVAFVFTLRDSGVEFVCADMLDANTLTIGVMATMAQYEREILASEPEKP